MSEREFLDLLNLYLDREITPADADRLEREIRSNALRRRTYLQYCQMQRAVRLLGSAKSAGGEHRSPADPASDPAAIRELGEGRWVWIGALAAAAVLLVAFAGHRMQSARTTPEDLLATETVLQDAVALAPKPSLGLSGDALLLSTFPVSGSEPKIHQDEFNWMRQFELVSLAARLGSQPTSPSAVTPQPLAAPRPAGQEAAETAAFKFVK